MKRILLLPVLLAVIINFACPALCVATPIAEVNTTPPPAKLTTPGVEMAQAVSTITGVAISPLIGVSAVGAWKYWETAPPQRAALPWFAQPWFWLPAFFVVGLCALKDSFGTVMPTLFKKPLDILETIEHKISGLVAVGAFVPFVAMVFRSTGANVPASINLSVTHHEFLAVINSSWLGNVLAVPILMWVFLMVFLASNAINILILLSPFPVVDAALKLFRLFALGTVVITSYLNPWLGAVWSLIIIVIAYFLAGWSLRLWHFGMVFIWEKCTWRYRRFTPEPFNNRMFLSRKIKQTPIRTYGTLSRNEQGVFIFKYHPWFVLPEREIELPAGAYAVAKGLFYSEIARVENKVNRPVLLLPPRYRSHETELVTIYHLTGVREAGLRAAFAWLKDWLGFRSKPPVLATA